MPPLPSISCLINERFLTCFPSINSPEHRDLSLGNLERCLEVEPPDHLIAGWSGEAALVSGVPATDTRLNQGLQVEGSG